MLGFMQNFQELALYARKAVMWQIVIFFFE